MYVSFAAMVAITAVVGWQVWGRYVLNDTPAWAERTALLLVLYFSLLGAAVGVREQFHLGIVFVRDALPERARRPVEILNHLLVGGFGAGMMWFGSALAAVTASHGIPTLHISESFTYLPIPLSGAAIVFFSGEHLLRMLARAGGEAA
ncbi:MAG: TRAP transporter small permease [Rhodospirillales bacterium]|nr:TRAP transporter small permease [Rhodospirillales bacterium]